jgi:septal ring factor EnvC (AmiA/AmiB activator)
MSLFAQSSKQIEKENSRLTNLRNQIDKIEADIKKNEKREKISVSVMNDIDRKILLVNNYINELKREVVKSGRRIKALSSKSEKNEREIKKLQENFSKLVIWYYKFGERNELDLLLNASTMSDAMSKLKYLKIISDETKKTITDLRDKRKKLNDAKLKLVSEKKSLKKLLSAKKKEMKSLVNSKTKKKRLIAKLRKNKNSLLDELKNKRLAEDKIRDKIAELIRLENERLAKKKNTKEELEEFASYDLSGFENFSELRGRLNWPVGTGKISRKFGKQRNAKLKTVTLNYGIDIKTKSNAFVRAVAGGVVSVIDWIPGYGSVLILTHKNGYRTVYGHLTDIQVTQGDKVNSRVILGRVNESLEGNIIHFEIWKERQYQNPEKWLVRK